MKASGPKHERETIINFNEEDDAATIWTASDVIYRRLKKRGFEPTEEGERHAVFTMPKRAILMPRVKKPISEAQRAELRRRATVTLGAKRPKTRDLEAL